MTILKLKSISFRGVTKLSQIRINKDFLLYLLILAFFAFYLWIVTKYFIVGIICLLLSVVYLIWVASGCPRPFIKKQIKN